MDFHPGSLYSKWYALGARVFSRGVSHFTISTVVSFTEDETRIFVQTGSKEVTWVTTLFPRGENIGL